MGAVVVGLLDPSDRDVHVYDVDPARTAAASSDGAVAHESSASLTAAVDTLVTVLPGHAELLDAAPAMLAGLRPGTLWIDMTTGDPRTSRRLASAAADVGVLVVSVLISGSVEQLRDGTATLLVSGPADALRVAEPFVGALSSGAPVRHVGADVGDAQAVKLLGNLLWFANALAAAEALLIGKSLGLGPERLRELLRDGPGDSAFLADQAERLLDGDVMPGFGLDRVVEELRTGASLARSAAITTPQLDASLAAHEAALAVFGPAAGELLGVRWLELRADMRLRR
jgi:3-hydroxyisobutyrate dehydrogenase